MLRIRVPTVEPKVDPVGEEERFKNAGSKWWISAVVLSVCIFLYGILVRSGYIMLVAVVYFAFADISIAPYTSEDDSVPAAAADMV